MLGASGRDREGAYSLRSNLNRYIGKYWQSIGAYKVVSYMYIHVRGDGDHCDLRTHVKVWAAFDLLKEGPRRRIVQGSSRCR